MALIILALDEFDLKRFIHLHFPYGKNNFQFEVDFAFINTSLNTTTYV